MQVLPTTFPKFVIILLKSHSYRILYCEGLVCAHTRNVGRLKPKGGVTYDETKRYRKRIEETET